MIKQNLSQKLAVRPCAGWFPALFVLAGWLALVTPLRADNPPMFVFQIDASAVPGGFSPNSVALDGNNNVYVADADNSRIEKFSSSGAYLAQWGGSGSGNGQLEYPFGISVDSSNNVYVVDNNNSRIEKFSGSGTYLTQWGSYGSGNGQFEYPLGIAVDTSDNVYVVDNYNSRIEKFSSSGVYLTQWGSSGSGNGQFDNPEGIAVDSSNHVYVADYYNDRIEEFSSSGTYLAQWGNGQFAYPSGIAVDSNNHVYVADSDNDRVEKFDSSGNYLTQWGSYGSGNGQFAYPEDIAVDSSGNFIYVVDGDNGRIEVFVNNTNIIPPFITQPPTNQTVPAGCNVTFSVGVAGAAPFSYQWNSNNVAVAGATNAAFTLTNVTFSDSGTYAVLVSNSYGSVLNSNAVLTVLPAAEFVPPTFVFQMDASAVPGGFAPYFVALDTSNNVYVTDHENNRVLRLTAGGAYLSQWGSFGTNHGQFEYPEGIAVDSSNNIYVADYDNSRIEKFSSRGAYLSQWGSFGTTNGQFAYSSGIAVDSGNNIYVADTDNSRIEKFDSNGNYLTQWGSDGSGNGQFGYPQGIAVDSSNNVYVADTDNSRIEKFSSSGTYLTQWGSFGTNNGQFGYPQGIAVDSSNNVYVADTDNSRIEKFNAYGVYIRQWGSYGSGSSQFSGPAGIALDSAGNYLYVADAGNDRIEVFVNDTNIIPPFIVQEPTNQTTPAGANVTLNIGVVGAALAYQWSSNNVAVAGATNAAFTLTNVTLSDSAAYAVLVGNRYGSVLSSNAVLTVLPAAEFLAPTYWFEIDASAVLSGFEPSFLALDSNNNLYASDDGNNRIVKFSSNGTYLAQWGSSGSGYGQFENPAGVAVDSRNNVYVADSGNYRMEKFSSSGTYLTEWVSFGFGNGQFFDPVGVAVDSSNTVYVANTVYVVNFSDNDPIDKFSSSGAYLTQWGTYGSGDGQLIYPNGIAVDSSDTVYVADTGNNRVEKFDGNGNYLTQWGSGGTNTGQFEQPFGIAVDTSDNVYVADAGNYRIEKFSSSGAYLTQWGSSGSGNGQFKNLQGVAVDRSGNFIYVADGGRIQVFVNNTNIVPPMITSQPVSQAVPAGFNVTFSVGTIGTAPFSYQWNSNNIAVAGATNATLTLTNVSLSGSGNYAVLVANSYGSVLSSNAVLAVLPAAESVAPTYLFGIDVSAALNGFEPSFLALDSGNNVYVAGENDRVVKLTAGGAYLTQWGSYGSGNGEFDGPEGIAVDSSSNVYVADNYNNRIEKFNSSGAYLNQWGGSGSGNGQLNYPNGIAVDSGNNVYVADTYGRIEKFSSSGTYLTEWGGGGTNNGQLDQPEGVAVDSSDNIYVVDSYNNRVEKFDGNGNYLAQWGSYGTNNGQFENPFGIAVDISDNVYVADAGNYRIEKFSSSGTYLTQWGNYGSGYGQFENPTGVAVNSSGNLIYVVDSLNDRIQVFANNTNLIPLIITSQPASQTVPAGNNVTFSVSVVGTAPFSYQWNSNNIVVTGATNATFTLTKASLSESGSAYSVLVSNDFGSAWSSNAMLAVLPAVDFLTPAYLFQIDTNTVPGVFKPLALALDSGNNVYVADSDDDRIVKFSSSGMYLTQWGSYGSGNGQLNYPTGIAVDSRNNVYVVDYNDRVAKFDSSGNFLAQWGSDGSGDGQFYYPDGIAVDSSNNVYVADSSNYRVEKFSSSGTYLAQWGSDGSGNGKFDFPQGIAVDSSNHVYVTDYENSRVEKFDGNGNYLTQWGSYGTNNGQFFDSEGVAVDGSNNVYITDAGNDRIEKFDSSGNFLTEWGTLGTNNGQFENAVGVAVDSSGNFIYVADWGNFRIQVFANNANIVPPIITQQPTNQTVPAGVNVTFSVGTIGTAPFSYQWNFNNVAVAGATNATFTLTNVSLSDSGNYAVLVTNRYGSVLSSNVVLIVLPTLATTQPASGRSATGAVLNGSVTAGPDETVVWFDWGTDTNYGNITGATIVPGNSGNNSISATLSGLPGNVYHYRLDAANDFGIAYGADQSFTVGFPPSATTLSPTNGASGATLEAMVNPEGWDTTVYFQWETPTLTNTTPSLDIGAGVTALNVSRFVSGLTLFPTYQYQVVASNALGTVVGNLAYDPNQHQYFFSGPNAYSGSETNITLPPGTYIITVYGAAGGRAAGPGLEGYGAEMSAEFNFSTSTTLTLLVGESGFSDFYGFPMASDGGGGGDSFVVETNTPLVVAGGGGGAAYSQSAGGSAGGDATISTYGSTGSGTAGGSGGAGGNGGTGGDNTIISYVLPALPAFRAGEGAGGGGGFYTAGGGGYLDYSDGGLSFEAGGGFVGGGDDYFDSASGAGGFGGGGGGYWNEGAFGGGGGGYSGGGGGGEVLPNDEADGGGGGGSIIDSSAMVILAEVSGILSPDDRGNGEIIITTVTPPPLAISTNGAFGFTNGVFGFDVTGPAGASVVIQASTDLHTWIPLQTNLLGSGPLYFSDPQSATNVQRFYRAQLSP